MKTPKKNNQQILAICGTKLIERIQKKKTQKTGKQNLKKLIKEIHGTV